MIQFRAFIPRTLGLAPWRSFLLCCAALLSVMPVGVGGEESRPPLRTVADVPTGVIRRGNTAIVFDADRQSVMDLFHLLSKTIEQTGADGVYVDEFGFGWQYPCHRKDHGHEVPGSQIEGEAQLLEELRAALPSHVVVYTEETPNDYTTRFLDGSFTYAIAQSRNALNPARVNLTRFALPDVKLFEIIRCDVPLGDDLEAVRHVFFNGEGIWLEGPLSKPEWFPPTVRTLIARCHRILRTHREAFCDLDPVPLVPTLKPSVYANRFRGDGETVWTMFNADDQPAEGDLLRVAHTAGTKYFDPWNERPLTPRIEGPWAYLPYRLGPHEVGCIVQQHLTP